MDRGAWWATVHGIAKSRTCLSNPAHTHIHINSTQTTDIKGCDFLPSTVQYPEQHLMHWGFFIE